MSVTSLKSRLETLLANGIDQADVKQIITEVENAVLLGEKSAFVSSAERQTLIDFMFQNVDKFEETALVELALYVKAIPESGPSIVASGEVANPKSWTETYWPMAGKLDKPDGEVRINLWSKDGPLDKLDALVEKFTGTRGTALAHEKRPNLNFLVGGPQGYYIPSATLDETDAERTTGVDFNGNGTIDPLVAKDFINGLANFGKDGLTTGTMNVGWWGHCNAVAAAGLMYQQPQHDVTVNGITFTRQDIRGLLSVIAEDQDVSTGWIGNRYDDQLSTVLTRSGEKLQGRITSETVLGRAGAVRVGDMVAVAGMDSDVTIQILDGTTRTIPAADVLAVEQEDKSDIDPITFHQTVRSWLASGRGAVADRDRGSHVWNYNFYEVEDEITTVAPAGLDLPKLEGLKGPPSGGKVTFVERSMYYADSKNPILYHYWLEEKDGVIVNGGWLSRNNPDFVWQPQGFKKWEGVISRNPGVDIRVVRALYEASIAPEPLPDPFA
jgi:hypothetical protein